MYAQLEEEHGLAKRAMNIYDRAATAVQDADKFDVSHPAASVRRSRYQVPIPVSLVRCTRFTSQKRLQTTVSPPLGPSTSVPSKSYRTGRRRKCVSDLQQWNESSEKSTVPERSTRTLRNSAIRERIPSSGGSGIPSKVSFEMGGKKILCCKRNLHAL